MEQIAAAFVKAQKGFAPALKSSQNPHFKSRYADLAACVEAVIDALNANGIALMQKAHDCDSGVKVETVFVHESGQTMSGGVLHVPAAKSDPQGYGSALTYARRYALMAACGIAPEDDDGNAASANKGPAKAFEKAHSPTAITFDNLPANWKDYLASEAENVERTFAKDGANAASTYIKRLVLEPDHEAGLFHLLGSKTRTAINAITKGKA